MPATLDQSIQVNFPVLLRSQQIALKRYATVADIKPPLPRAHGATNWSTTPRPKSLHLSLETPISARLSASTPCNTLSPRQYLPDTHSSCAGSDISINERVSPGNSMVYSGHFRAVQQNKWKLPPSYMEDHLRQSPCTCQRDSPTTKSMMRANTPEGLSWRRLHMSRAKLKATATTSELLSGFAMVAMVELQINEPTTVPEWLFVLFAVCTTILVAVHIFALMISTYILPNIDAISKLDVCELVNESPHERMRGFIELAWAFSTILGLFLFLVEIAILCWVKFWDYSFTAAIAATVIVIPVLVMFVAFAVHFYHSLVVYKCDTSVCDIKKLEDMKKELDQAISPV